MTTSTLHEGVVALFRRRPELATTLLREALRVTLPDFDAIEIVDAAFARADVSPLRADLVLRLVDRGGAAAVLVLEVQREPDDAKRFDWPAYAALAAREHGCDAWLLVVTLEERVAAWARRVLREGPMGPLPRQAVLGPSGVPWVVDAAAAEASPELTMLAALAHGPDDTSASLAPAVWGALRRFDEGLAAIYADEVLRVAADALRAVLERTMVSGYEFKSDFMRKLVADGLAEGRAAGHAEARAADVLTFLEARGFVVSDEVAQRVRATRDLALLDKLVRRAATIEAVEELFE